MMCPPSDSQTIETMTLPPPQRMGGFPGVSCWGPGGSQIEDSSPVEISHSGDNFSDHPVGDTEGKTKMPGRTIP